MALTPIVPDTIDIRFVEKIRDRIAEIILVELPIQANNRGDTEMQKINKVFIERMVPFSSENLPAINVLTENIQYDLTTQNSRNFTAEFAVHVYAGLATDDTSRGDEKTGKFVQTLANIIESILMYGGYDRLGFEYPSQPNMEGVSNRDVYQIQLFNPENTQDAIPIVRAGLMIRVTGNQPLSAVTPVALQGSDTKITLFNSNDGYLYSTSSGGGIPSDPGGCQPVLITNSDESLKQYIESGEVFILPNINHVITNSEGTEIINESLPSAIDVSGVLPDIQVTDSDGTTSSYPSGKDVVCTPSGVCDPATIQLNGETMTTIPSGDTENILVLQSDDMTQVGSKQGTHFRIDDSTITLDGDPFTTVKAEGTIDITIVNQNGDDVNINGSTGPQIEVQLPVTAGLAKDGQTPYGEGVDHTTLSENNPFGNTSRFTDLVGGQTYADNIQLDWNDYSEVNKRCLAYYTNYVSGAQWAASKTACAALNIAGFTGWRMWRILEYYNICDMSKSHTNPFPTPFSTPATYLWLLNENVADPTQAYMVAFENQISHRRFGKTSASLTTVAVRDMTVTISGGSVILT